MSNRKKYDEAKSKINAYKTVRDQRQKERQLKSSATKENKDEKKQESKKQLSELKNDKKVKELKSNLKNQLEELLDIYKLILPSRPNSSGLSVLGQIFLQACENTKGRIIQLLVDNMISTIGCSEEQNYATDVPLYIKVSQVDLFKILLEGPETNEAKFYYEKEDTDNGEFPYSMNRQLYHRLQNTTSFQQEYGANFIGSSGRQLFNIRYVNQYVDSNGVTQNGDFYEVTLTAQNAGTFNVSSFLTDYFQSIDVFNIDSISVNLLDFLTGAFSFSLNIGKDELVNLEKFTKVITRIFGLCFNPDKKIDVSGVAKLPELDIIDDDFFEVSNQDLRNIENKVNLIANGLVEFEDCNNVQLPINVQAVSTIMQEIITEVSTPNKITKLFKGFNDLANDPNWQNELSIGIDLTGNFLLNTIKNIPLVLVKSLLSPKTMLGFLIMLKSILNSFDIEFNNLTEFLKTFKKFIVDLARQIFAIFVEELFNILKKEIKRLVESLLLDIINEAKSKRVQMYSTIVYILLQLTQAFIDFRHCQSVIDEILKLLNLGLSKLNLGLPLFALAASGLLPGVSDTRSFANVIENLQKAGLPTGDNGDGSPNMMNIAMFGLIQGQNKEQAENGKTEVFIPALPVAGGFTPAIKTSGKSY